MKNMNNEFDSEINNQKNRRSIRNLKRDSDSPRSSRSKPKPSFSDEKKYASRRYRSTNRQKYVWFFGIAIALLLVFWLISWLFHRANVVVTPRVETVSIMETVTAGLGEYQGVDIGYNVHRARVEGSRTIESVSTETVSQRASGTISVYNEATETPQRLITNTRFQSPDGLVYRVQEAITIPGRSGNQPGVLEGVRVFADEPGEAHNGSVEGDFSVPGLIATDLEGLVYARATSDFQGGFVGQRPVADEAQEQQAIESLEETLIVQVQEAAVVDLPAGFIQITTLDDEEFTVLPSEVSGNDLVIKAEASVSVVVVSEIELATYALAQVGLTNFRPEALRVNNPESLGVSLQEDEDEVIELTFTRPIEITWDINRSELLEDIKGMSLSNLRDYERSSEEISGLEVSVGPFWRRSLPERVGKINLTIEGFDFDVSR